VIREYIWQQEAEDVRWEQLLRWRYGQKRERIDENQLFLFAASVIRRASPPAWPAMPAAKRSLRIKSFIGTSAKDFA
jgi:hypothetical protein